MDVRQEKGLCADVEQALDQDRVVGRRAHSRRHVVGRNRLQLRQHVGTLLGECSVSNKSQSKPAGATISAANALGRLHHSPICWRPTAIARLKRFSGMFMGASSGPKATQEGQARAHVGPQLVHAAFGRDHALVAGFP